MRTLRGSIWGTNVTASIILAFSAATIMTILNPRPVSAEGPLLGTVRCLLGTVLTGECRQATTPAPAVTPAPAPTPAPATPSQPSQAPASSPPSQSQPASSNTSRTNQNSFNPVEVDTPGQVTAALPEVKTVAESTSPYSNMSGAEYLAYFNKYSNYAVAGAEQQAASVSPIERTGEGWRIFGVAWYWWGIALICVSAIFISVKRRIVVKQLMLNNT